MLSGIKLVILFGSRATGYAKAGSDYDIGVLGNGDLSFERKAKVREIVAEELSVSEDKIDIIDISSASPLLRQKIATEGKLLRGSQEEFLKFKILSWRIYQDTAKFRRMREEFLSQTGRV